VTNWIILKKITLARTQNTGRQESINCTSITQQHTNK